MAFGLLLSGFAGGNLVGYGLAAAAPRAGSTALRRIILALLAGIAAVLAILGASPSTWVDLAALAALGLGNGYVTIALISMLQARAPHDMLGRVMALVTFSSFGLVPVSTAFSGVISSWSVTGLFAGAAGLSLGVMLWTARQAALGALSDGITARAQTRQAH